MLEIIARREFSPFYIGLDIIFLIVLATLLLWKKKYMTVVVGLLAGLLYMAVDYGIFHLVCGDAPNLGGTQPVLGAAVDVHELRLHEFCLDLAVDSQG